ncbi:hypothetical protein GN958_ATG17021, partial [Phytophthora infestans]
DGWTSKKPSGLSVDFIYLKPGKTITDVEGEDVFIGDDALMKYLDKIDLMALRAKKQARRDGSASAAGRRSAAKAAKPVTAKLPRYLHLHRLNGNFSRPPQFVYVPKVRHTRPHHRIPVHHWILLQVHQRGRYKLIHRMLQLFLPAAIVNIPSEAQEVISGITHVWTELFLYVASSCVGDSPISQRNLAPDFEEAELSSNASDHSEADNQMTKLRKTKNLTSLQAVW